MPQNKGWHLAFREITNATNKRTVICAILPGVAMGGAASKMIVDAYGTDIAASPKQIKMWENSDAD